MDSPRFSGVVIPFARVTPEKTFNFWLRKWTALAFLRGILGAQWLVSRIVRCVFDRGRERNKHSICSVMLTGTFYSENWVMNHLRPLANSPACSRVWLISNISIPSVAKVQTIPIPPWLRKLTGQTIARLLVFVIAAIRYRPDIVGGFHLLVNGLVASLVAPVIRARSIYFCGGGPLEVLGGGFYADNRLFDLLRVPDEVLERQLIRAVGQCDLVITMGSRTIDFFQGRGVNTRFEIVPGGIDGVRYQDRGEPKTFDLIFVGQLIPIKRVDLFLEIVKCVAEKHPDVNAVVVGTGRLEESLRAMAFQLGIQDRVTFAGYQADVAPWLNKSKLLLLTSDSEGLSLAMMEAMLCGLPCIVSDVGELGELIEHGVNGYLVKERSAPAFSECVVPLLQDNQMWQRLSGAARVSAARYETPATTERWTALLRS